jgi:hypothetical protein
LHGITYYIHEVSITFDKFRTNRGRTSWRSPDIGVYTLLPSRHFIDAKTRAWLTWVEQHISPKIQSDTDYFL